jgi:hypothetical protein
MPIREMHVRELEGLIEWELRRIIEKHFPLDWKEDLITHDLAIAFRNRFKNITLHGLRNPLDIDWEIYKLHGQRESNYGDIGLLFRYRRREGKILEGAGFLEAKLRGRKSTKFAQVRQKQIKRILAKSPQTRLLLYDQNPIPVLDADYLSDVSGVFLGFRHQFTYSRVTHGAVIPLQLAAAINRYDDTLYRFCHSLSYQFSQRYFNLHDLDFRSNPIKAVKGFAAELDSPNIVMVVRAAAHGQELPESFRPNENIFSPIVEG